jgi:uracil phosphoribosyltransferase
MPRRTAVCDHPVMQGVLAELRNKKTKPARFRELMEDAGVMLGLTALSDAKMRKVPVKTPMKSMQAAQIAEPVLLVAILRAGLGLVPGLAKMLPEAPHGLIGLYRDEETLKPVRYYVRLPEKLSQFHVLLLDPMLATGGSASESIHILKTDGAKKISLVTLLSTKPGISRVHKDHSDVNIVTGAIDPVLNKIGYIVPGLGDAGDRLFGT